MEISPKEEITLNELLPKIFEGLTNRKDRMSSWDAHEMIKEQLPKMLASEIDVEEILDGVQIGEITDIEVFRREVLRQIQRQLAA